jgi:hypothetical protein
VIVKLTAAQDQSFEAAPARAMLLYLSLMKNVIEYMWESIEEFAG